MWAEAVVDANKAIELDPKMSKAYLRKGWVYNHLSILVSWVWMLFRFSCWLNFVGLLPVHYLFLLVSYHVLWYCSLVRTTFTWLLTWWFSSCYLGCCNSWWWNQDSSFQDLLICWICLIFIILREDCCSIIDFSTTAHHSTAIPQSCYFSTYIIHSPFPFTIPVY